MIPSMDLSLFDTAIPYTKLPESDPDLKEFLNYNPVHNRYTANQNFPGRNPNETDRGGWRGYDRVYSMFFPQLRDQSIEFLEIGIMEGYGLLAWKRFFPNAKIYGVDNVIEGRRILEMQTIAKQFPMFQKVKTEYFDSTKPDDWLTFSGKRFDVIIDDGGHHPDTQVSTFINAWQYLKPGGLYIIEDISHRYTEQKLDRLHDVLLDVLSVGNDITVYSHHNAGLDHILNTPNLRKQMNIHPDALNIATEYIVAIRKKL